MELLYDPLNKLTQAELQQVAVFLRDNISMMIKKQHMIPFTQINNPKEYLYTWEDGIITTLGNNASQSTAFYCKRCHTEITTDPIVHAMEECLGKKISKQIYSSHIKKLIEWLPKKYHASLFDGSIKPAFIQLSQNNIKSPFLQWDIKDVKQLLKIIMQTKKEAIINV